MKKYIYLLILPLITILSACEKNTVPVISTPTTGARIKFYNFSLNSPGVNFYANEKKMTAIQSTTGIEAVTGVAYGSVGPASNYATIEGGQYIFKAQITAAIDKDLAIANLTTTVENSKYYSLYTCGFYNTGAKTSDTFIVEDKLPAFDNSATYVRFVNAIPNANSGMDFVVKNTVTLTETVVSTNIAYKNGSDFVKLLPGVYTIYTRYPGTNTNLITRADVSFVIGRVYTISSRGDMTVVSTTATNRPFLDNTANR
ncbi:MAG: DUF4397 domain-containing protein [Daejeonella sp.]